MMKHKNYLLKRDLVIIPTIVYFSAYALYLFLEKFLEKNDYALLVKPIIIPAIAFLYLTGRKSKRTILNLVFLIMVFIADNTTLLEDQSLYVYSTMLYMGTVYILLYYAILDFKWVKKDSLFSKYLGFGLLIFVFSILFYWAFFYNHLEKSSQFFIVKNYMLVFVVTMILSIVNYFLNKRNKRDKFLMLSMISLFLTMLFSSIDHYYMSNSWLVLMACIIEIPVYYFLLKYLLARDQKVIPR